MSNTKRRKDKGKTPYILLTEENKEDFAKVLGYSVKYCEEMLAKAKADGFVGVRFPRPPGL